MACASQVVLGEANLQTRRRWLFLRANFEIGLLWQLYLRSDGPELSFDKMAEGGEIEGVGSPPKT